MQVKCYLYLLPKPARPVHLIRCQQRPAIAVSLPGTKPTLTCVFCPKSDALMAATSSRRVVTRQSVDGAAHPVHTPKQAVEQGFPLAGRDDR